MTDEKKKEFTRKITAANKTGLITILYEMLEEYLLDAKRELECGRITEFGRQLGHAGGCVNELMNSINFEHTLAGAFLQLYLYMNRELISARVNKTEEPLNHILQILTKLKESYLVLQGMDDSDPVMSNTQQVYVGITYDRQELSENVMGAGTVNRGYLV